jgi:hypothetical protein
MDFGTAQDETSSASSNSLGIGQSGTMAMAITFQPVRLPRELDSEALLVLKDGVLLAIVCKLSEIHEEQAGRWYPELVLADAARRTWPAPATLQIVTDWVQRASGVRD